MFNKMIQLSYDRMLLGSFEKNKKAPARDFIHMEWQGVPLPFFYLARLLLRLASHTTRSGAAMKTEQ